VHSSGHRERGRLNVPVIIYDFWGHRRDAAQSSALTIGGSPQKPEPEPKTAEPMASEDWFGPLTRFSWEG
jgi:hypothetical protein